MNARVRDSQFVDTHHNQDCHHHTLTFSRTTTHCPYCQAPSKRYVREATRRTFRAFGMVAVVACLLFLLWRTT